jgi:hypothetical protein
MQIYDPDWWLSQLLARKDDNDKYIEWYLRADWGPYKVQQANKALEDKWAWMSEHPKKNKLATKRKNVLDDASDDNTTKLDTATRLADLAAESTPAEKPPVPDDDSIEVSEEEPPPKKAKKSVAIPAPRNEEMDKIRVAISDLGNNITEIKDKRFQGVRMHFNEIERCCTCCFRL